MCCRRYTPSITETSYLSYLYEHRLTRTICDFLKCVHVASTLVVTVHPSPPCPSPRSWSAEKSPPRPSLNSFCRLSIVLRWILISFAVTECGSSCTDFSELSVGALVEFKTLWMLNFTSFWCGFWKKVHYVQRVVHKGNNTNNGRSLSSRLGSHVLTWL